MKNRALYLSEGLDVLSHVGNYADGRPQIQTISFEELKGGMRIQEDLRMINGTFIAPRGTVISD